MDASTWYLANTGAFTSLINYISAVANSSIPNLAPGNYLICHEIIALQLAVSIGGTEFYPSCSQFRVGGDQTGAQRPSDLVSLPGSYSDAYPGIYAPDVYDPDFTYTFPGPPIALSLRMKTALSPAILRPPLLQCSLPLILPLQKCVPEIRPRIVLHFCSWYFNSIRGQLDTK